MRVIINTVDHLVTAPTAPAIDLEWAKRHIKSLSNEEDELVEGWIAAATQYFEEQTGHQVMLATREFWLDTVPCDTKIELPRPPLQSVESVIYIASDGTETSFSDGASPETVSWQFRAPEGVPARRGWVEANYGVTWPIVRVESGAVRIRYTCGYAETDAGVPALVRSAICMILAQYEQFRSELHLSDRSAKIEQVPTGAVQIMRGFKYAALPSQVLQTWR